MLKQSSAITMIILWSAFILASCDGGNKENPAPIITAVAPESALAGSAGFTLRISGSGFVSKSVVRWKGSNRATAFVSSTELKAQIPSSDIAVNGIVEVSVYNPGPGGGVSNIKSFAVNGPVPAITSISPLSLPAGSAAFTLTVNGTNFFPSSIVHWNGFDRPVVYIGSTKLIASISAADIAAAGSAEIVVHNPFPADKYSNTATFAIGNPKPIISALSPASHPAGGSTFTLTVHGSKFLPSSVVRWNGVNRSTRYIDSMQLTSEISAIDIAAAGSSQIQVFNPDGEVSGSLPFVVTAYPSEWTFLGVPTVDGMPFADVLQIVVDAQDPRILYVSTLQAGLLMSRDGGMSWSIAIPQSDPPGIGAIAADPDAVDRIFYGSRNQLYVSNDRGISWRLLHTFDPKAYFISLLVSGIDSHTLFAGFSGVNGVFYRSNDDGESWQSYSFGQTIGIDNFIPWSIAEDRLDGVLYVGVELGNHVQPYRPPFLRSMDGGETWKNIVESVISRADGPTWHVISIVVHPDNHKLFALTEGSGLYTSMDHGFTWKREKYSRIAGGLVMDPIQTNRLFATSVVIDEFPGGTFISLDGGESFSPFGLEGFSIGSLALTSDGRQLFAAVYQAGLYVTQLPQDQRLMSRRRVSGR